MRLQSHEIQFEDTDALHKDIKGNVKLVNDAGEVALTVCSDFHDLANTDPNAISVSTLLQLAMQTLQHVGAPHTHATAWRAVYNNIGSAIQAIEYSQQLLNIESAKPYSLPIQFTFKSSNLLAETPPTVINFNPGDVTVETYFELIGRLMSYHHNYELVDGVLNIELTMVPEMLPMAQTVAESLIKKDQGFRVAIYEPETLAVEVSGTDAKLRGSVFIPGYLCKTALELAMVFEEYYGDSVKVAVMGDNKLNLTSLSGLNVERNIHIVIQKLEAQLTAA